MSTTATLEELRSIGLLDRSPQPHLTPKGLEWLRTLEHLGSQADPQEDSQEDLAADLVLSTNGLFR